MGVPTEVALTLHGKIANSPASRVEVQVIPGDPTELVVVGEVHEAGLFCPQYRPYRVCGGSFKRRGRAT